MPLGQLSAAQFQRGYDALQALEDGIGRKASRAELENLSSAFYQVVPHAFSSRERLPVIDSLNTVA
ncbi:unnamed protein product, partial [Phaeothamnion confervicola]